MYPSRPIPRDPSVLTDLGRSATCRGQHVVNVVGPVPDVMGIEGRSLLSFEIKLPKLWARFQSFQPQIYLMAIRMFW